MDVNDIIETSHYDWKRDKLIVKTSYNNELVLKSNIEAQKSLTDGQIKYKPGPAKLVHVGSIHMGDIVRLKNLGYDLMSPDPDESRRALCYIQNEEKHLLTVPGKPFARQRKAWA